jgi:hypothetical protein
MDKRVKDIKIGIAFEGKRDITPLEILIQRILAPNFNPVILKRRSPYTGLIGYTKLFTKDFFELGDTVDVAVFVTDQDKQKKRVKNTILKIIEGVNPTYKLFSVVGVPDPHFEEWLLTNQGYVKNYFGLEATQPLTIIDNSPKITIEHLQRNMEDPRKPLFNVYTDLAKEANLATSRTLKTFASELFSVCQTVS